jgi:hypothetical protein
MVMFFQFAIGVTMMAEKKESFEEKKTLNIGRGAG